MTNVEQLRANTSSLFTYGVIMNIMQVTSVILANIKNATKYEYGQMFCAAMKTTQGIFHYNCVHEKSLIASILVELAAANASRRVQLGRGQSRRTHPSKR